MQLLYLDSTSIFLLFCFIFSRFFKYHSWFHIRDLEYLGFFPLVFPEAPDLLFYDFLEKFYRKKIFLKTTFICFFSYDFLFFILP